MFGLLNVNKPPGPTSHGIVAVAQRRLGRRVKVGHAGTLDPFADGVLVLCVGGATRLTGYIQAQPKRYAARITLGATSSTGDPQGVITTSPPVAHQPELDEVEDTLGQFVGQIEQVPPAHSALHVNGQRAYKLARQGREVNLPARTVTIHAIELVRYEYPLLDIDVRCGCGTYIRALARDVGAALGGGGYCSKLTRTAVGDFRIQNAVKPDEINPEQDLLDALEAVRLLPKFQADPADVNRLANGRPIELSPGGIIAPNGSFPPGDEVIVVDPAGRLLAIATVTGNAAALQPKKVFISR